MTVAPQVTFRNMETDPELDAAVQKEAGGLDRFFNRIVSCRVVIEGGPFRVRIELGAPGEELVVDYNSTLRANPRRTEARAAIHEAFQEMRRRLQDYARRMRGDMKHHEGLSQGTVTKLSPEEGFGFLETDGHGVYFHRNSVLAGHFDRLRIGSQVRFTEEAGEKGPQASSVRLVRSARQGRSAAANALLAGTHREGAAS